MKIPRHFTGSHVVDPYHGITFVARTSKIVEPNGKVVFSQENVWVPDFWSQTATDILAQKYFRKAGVPQVTVPVDEEGIPAPFRRSVPAYKTHFEGESNARQVFHRLAGAWTYHGLKNSYFTTDEDAQAFYDEVCFMLAHQMAAPNSPQYFNSGLHWAYGITGPAQGHWRVNHVTEEVEQTNDSYSYPQSHACYINSIEDDLVNEGGIMDLWTREARIFKLGSGAGSSFSSIRGKGEPLSGGGKSSGLLSFLKIGDASGGAIKSGGTVRRAARMIVLDMDHPDIEEFITWKVREETKVAALCAGSRILQRHTDAILTAYSQDMSKSSDLKTNKALARAFALALEDHVPLPYCQRILALAEGGAESILVDQYTPQWEEEAYQTVSGQNANNSIRVPDTFMKAVEEDGDWHLYWRTELVKARQENRSPRPCRTVKASDLWQEVVQATWSCADPGVQFDTTINDWHTCPASGRQRASNPCCFTGDTLIETTAGRLSLAFLTQRSTLQEDLPAAYAWDLETHTPVVRPILRAWCAGNTSTLVLIRLDSGVILRCTPDHHLLRADGVYVSARSLVSQTDAEALQVLHGGEPDSVLEAVVVQLPEPVAVYDLEVEGCHNYAVSNQRSSESPSIVVHNSEFLYLDDTSCNLASVNLLRFYWAPGIQPRPYGTFTSAKPFDVGSFVHATRLWTLILEITVAMAQYPSRQIALNSYRHRTLGLGYTNLGALLMAQGIPYDSSEGRALAGVLTALLHFTAYATSAEMAGEVGPFAEHQANAKAMFRVIKNHYQAATGFENPPAHGLSIVPPVIEHEQCPHYLLEAVFQQGNKMLAMGKEHGYRNAQISTLAPTGTISLIMDADCTGIEPDFALVKFKKLAGGGYFRIVNQSLVPALLHLGYSQEEARDIVYYVSGHKTLDGCPHVNRDSLRLLGISEPTLYAFEKAIASSFSLEMACTTHLLSDVERERLKIADSVPLLAHLGFTSSQIEEANTYACGTGTVEGAPCLRPEHYAVFDCAVKCGRIGTRSLSPVSHIDMVAAVQPFISGGISKTISCPFSVTPDDIGRLLFHTWKKGVKCSSIYRDGSKLSQPLAAATIDLTLLRQSLAQEEAPPQVRIEKVIQYLSQRRRLPTRRHGYTQKARIGNHTVYLRTGEYEDGTLGEIFIDMHKEGAAFRSMANCLAIAVSLGLQYGIPLDEFVDAFVGMRFEPNGPVQGHECIKLTSSLVDYFFRDLGVTYLGRKDLRNVLPEPQSTTVGEDQAAAPGLRSVLGNGNDDTSPIYQDTSPSPQAVLLAQARAKGYLGDPCPDCGQLTLLQAGTCIKCDSCGSTSGC
jgi:ribonucleotide reductase alpha subunit